MIPSETNPIRVVCSSTPHSISLRNNKPTGKSHVKCNLIDLCRKKVTPVSDIDDDDAKEWLDDRRKPFHSSLLNVQVPATSKHYESI